MYESKPAGNRYNHRVNLSPWRISGSDYDIISQLVGYINNNINDLAVYSKANNLYPAWKKQPEDVGKHKIDESHSLPKSAYLECTDHNGRIITMKFDKNHTHLNIYEEGKRVFGLKSDSSQKPLCFGLPMKSNGYVFYALENSIHGEDAVVFGRSPKTGKYKIYLTSDDYNPYQGDPNYQVHITSGVDEQYTEMWRMSFFGGKIEDKMSMTYALAYNPNTDKIEVIKTDI